MREFGEIPAELAGRQLPAADARAGPRPAQRVVTEEQFGPTVPILPVRRRRGRDRRRERHLGRAVLVGVDRGPGAGRRRSAPGCRSGYTWVNNHSAAFLDERAPFGGLRGSGFGREMGIEGLREFMDTHSVSFPVQG